MNAILLTAIIVFAGTVGLALWWFRGSGKETLDGWKRRLADKIGGR